MRRALAVCGACILAAALAQAAAVAPAQRIVSLAPSLTELVFAAGAGERMVGADAYSDYPPAAKSLPRVGDAFQVDYERVLTLKPDLVLVWDTGTPEAVIERLTGLGLHVERIRTARLEDVGPALRRIGELTGNVETAGQVADSYARDLATLKTEHAHAAPISVFFQITATPLYTVSGSHPISEIIELCGGRNIFADLPQLAPPVSQEAVLERDPEAILGGNDEPGDPFAIWRQWSRSRAVHYDNLLLVNSDLTARTTPRILAGVREICSVLDEARAHRARATP